jgi:hypothetical protein
MYRGPLFIRHARPGMPLPPLAAASGAGWVAPFPGRPLALPLSVLTGVNIRHCDHIASKRRLNEFRNALCGLYIAKEKVIQVRLLSNLD